MDIEASGFGRDSYPIEIGFVLPDGSAWCTLVRPEPQWQHWDPRAEAVHRISRDVAVRHGRNVTEVAGTLNERLRNCVVYCDGWAHDYPWLARLFDAAGLRQTFRLEHLNRLLDEDDTLRFGDMKQIVARETGPKKRHRASADALLLQTAWRRMQQPPGLAH